MHCELVVPGLLAGAGDARLPAAELLLARGRSTSSPPQSLRDWLLQAFEAEGRGSRAGALTVLAHGRAAGGELWARADPVHLQLMREHVVLVPGEILSLSIEESAALCEALNAHFGGRLAIEALEPGRWCARLEGEIGLPEESPLERAGRPVAPGGGADALLNEAQMVLHEHPVNEAREARGELPVNSLWLWGAGPAPQVGKPPWQSITSAEPIALGLARAAGMRARALPASAEEWLDRSPEEGRHLVVLDALRAPLALSDAASHATRLEALEQAWFAPILSALRAGRVGMVSVHVPDAGVAVETIGGDLRRFWRRSKPLGRRTMPP